MIDILDKWDYILHWTAITLATFSYGGLKKIKTFTRVGSPFSITTFIEDFAASGSMIRHPRAGSSIVVSIDDFWLISHEDESDDRCSMLLHGKFSIGKWQNDWGL